MTTATAPRLTLPAPLEMVQSLRAALPSSWQVEWQESTDSTNADLLAKARSSHTRLARPWLLGAHLQHKGRGRSGRTWQNRAGANLMFSCAFDTFLPSAKLPTLAPFAGLIACEALRGLLPAAMKPHLLMKWPNDIHWKFSKLAGILVEVTRSGASRLSPDHHVVIIGIGLNLDDARALSQSLNRHIADWAEIAAEDDTVAKIHPASIVEAIASAWYDAMNDVLRHGFGNLPMRYATVDTLAGRHIDVLDNGRLLNSGIACGINEQGQLLLRNTMGETPISVGEISVRLQP